MTESSGMSVADVAALSNNDGFGGTGGWLWFLIVMFAIWGGGFGYGNNNSGTADLNASMQRGFDNQNVMQRFDTLSQNQSAYAMDNLTLIDRNQAENANLINQMNINNLQSTANLTNAMNQGFNSVSAGIAQNTYDTTAVMNAGFNSVNQSICGLSHQISDGVCAIKTQMLQDKYDALLNEYNLSTMSNANSVQTQNILNAIGSWYAKPPYAPVYYGTAYGTSIS